MNRAASNRLKLWGLLLLDAALAFALVVTWRFGEDRVREPATLAPHRIANPDLQQLNPPILESANFTIMRDRAVFYSRRTYYPPAVPSEALGTPDFDFAGSMLLPQGQRVAFVKKRSDRSNRTLHVGDELDGWRVKDIDNSRVLLRHEEQSAELRSPIAASASAVGLTTIREAPIYSSAHPPAH